MAEKINTSYMVPLKWPAGYPSTPPKHRGYNSSFKSGLTLTEAVDLLREEIDAIGPEKATIFSDVEQLGIERLRRKVGPEIGVSIEIRIQKKLYHFACNAWNSLEQNVYALHLILRNYRLMSKWGVAELDRLMQGFCDTRRAYSTRNGISGVMEGWMEVLGLGPSANLEDAHAVYRRRAKLVANDEDELMILNNAMDEARKHLKA